MIAEEPVTALPRARTSLGTVLVIAYHFPPTGGVTAIRMAKVVKYLSRQGWDPIVLTAKGFRYYAPEDPSLLTELPEGLKVCPVPAWEARPLLGAFRRLGLRDAALLRLERLLFVPDPQVAWVLPALREGLRQVRRHRPRAIYATGAPWTSLLAGALLSRATGVPFVPHFADEWIRHPWYAPASPLHREANRLLERWVLSRSAAVSVPTALLPGRFLASHPGIPADRFAVVSNGFDEEDFGDPPPRETGAFTLLHAGSLDVGVSDPLPFFRALARFRKEEPTAPLRLRLLGFVDRPFVEALRSLGLEACVRLEGSRPHREALRACAAADVLVLLRKSFPGAECLLHAKSLEYLRTGRPVLAIVPDGPTARLLAEAGAGAPLAPGDEEGILARLRMLYAAWRADALPSRVPAPGLLAPYERARTTAVLSGVLDRVGRPC